MRDANSLVEVYPFLLKSCLQGRPQYSGDPKRGCLTYDGTMMFTILDPTSVVMASKMRRWNYRFALAESAWILSGSDKLGWLAKYNSKMRDFSDDGDTLSGAYGPRFVDQLPWVLESIKRDHDTRQAVITTWYPRVEGQRSKDVPCTVAFHFQVIHNRLCMTVFMRSNDVWLGVPYDVFSFTTIQRVVASMLRLTPGRYTHIASNFHIYEHDAEAARALLGAGIGAYHAPRIPQLPDNYDDVKTHLYASMCGSVNDSDCYFGELSRLDCVESTGWLAKVLSANGR